MLNKWTQAFQVWVRFRVKSWVDPESNSFLLSRELIRIIMFVKRFNHELIRIYSWGSLTKFELNRIISRESSLNQGMNQIDCFNEMKRSCYCIQMKIPSIKFTTVQHELWFELNQISDIHCESWIESNQIFVSSLQSWVDSIQTFSKGFEPWFDLIHNFGDLSWFASIENESGTSLVPFIAFGQLKFSKRNAKRK